MSHNSIHYRKIQLSLQENYIKLFYKNIILRIQISHNLSMKHNQIPVSLIVNQFQSSLFINMIQTLSINSNLKKINNSFDLIHHIIKLIFISIITIQKLKNKYYKTTELYIKYCFNGIKQILRNEIPKEQYKQLQYQHSIIVQVNNPFDLEYKYFGNTVKMNIVFHIKTHFQIEDIEMDFLQSESQMIWKNVGINRIVPKCMLQNISINKLYLNNEEGYIEVLLDWPAMLQNEQLQPDLPSRRLSLIQKQRHLYILDGDNKSILNAILYYGRLNQYKQLEVKYKDSQNEEYLALKIVLIIYSGKEHEIIFCPPSQIFGKKLNQKKDQPLVVLGITLSREKNLGVLQPNQLCETILRVQLINNGILNLQHINLKIDNQLTELSLNFIIFSLMNWENLIFNDFCQIMKMFLFLIEELIFMQQQ
ncbi:unnamed protein product [Paramecium pentaurelia]|uniref:Uncharacterized protein n=1 Tax=Paramecium pentaurelia TaxID=43138 RepID=A0A8S1UZI2_9CILI|nr:unnamed protein product [Paramecium pentaurelia]